MALQHHDAVAHDDAVDEEQERQPGREPQRVELRPRQQHHRPERGLVHGGEQDPEGQDQDEEPRHERQALLGEGPQARVGALPPLLEEGRRQLDQEHEDVGGDAERHLELRGVAPAPEVDRHLPQLPEPAEVHGDGQHGEAVAEEAGQDRGSDERVVLALVEDVDEERHRVAAAAEGGARDHVERDPDAPRVAVVEVADRGETGGEAPEHHDAAEGRDREEEPVGAGQDAARRPRGEGSAWVLTAAPPPRPSAALLAVPPEHRPERDVEGHGGGEALVEALLDRVGGVGHALRPVVGQAELLEGDVGQVEHLRAAGLRLAVDLRHVGAGVRGQAPLRLGQELGALAVDDRPARAHLAAGGPVAARVAAEAAVVGELRVTHAVAAQLALHDLRHRLVELELGHVERAGHLAVAAAHAVRRVVADDPRRLVLVQRVQHARARRRPGPRSACTATS